MRRSAGRVTVTSDRRGLTTARVIVAVVAAALTGVVATAGRVHCILTMRSDYVGDCAAFRDLPETLNDCQYLVPRMTRAQRKEAIEAPLGRVRISSALVQRLLNDVGDEPARGEGQYVEVVDAEVAEGMGSGRAGPEAGEARRRERAHQHERKDAYARHRSCAAIANTQIAMPMTMSEPIE